MVWSVAQESLGTAIETNAPLMSAGLDSIAAVEFVNVLQRESGLELSATTLFDHPTLDSISSFLLDNDDRFRASQGGAVKEYAPDHCVPLSTEEEERSMQMMCKTMLQIHS